MCCAASMAAAQGAATPPATVAASVEPSHSLNAGVSLGAVGVSFDEADTVRHFAYRLELGYRFPTWRSGPLRHIRLTPKVALLATHVGGMSPTKNSFAYASVDLAARATLYQWRLRPYGEARRTGQRAELLDARSSILNYKGTGSAFSLGIELPVAPSGRGFEAGITVATGRFTEYELAKQVTPADMSHRAVAVHIGWSGPFTGISLPWR